MDERKRPVEWHKKCLKNHRLSIEILKNERRRLTEEIERSEREGDYLQAQIERAEAEVITEFDAERFKPRKKWETK